MTTALILRRKVPSHSHVERFHWVKRQWMLFATFRRARQRKRLELLQDGRCHWCRRSFADDEQIALAGAEKGTNKLLCQACAEELERSHEVPA